VLRFEYLINSNSGNIVELHGYARGVRGLNA
jgi:hypothetical protein